MQFSGAKAALLIEDKLITILRDDYPHIPYPNEWELPGGQREGNETPFECLHREVLEELALEIHEAQILWRRRYQNVNGLHGHSWFMVLRLHEADIGTIVLGDEGQAWQLMRVHDFIHHPNAVAPHQRRLSDYLALTKVI